MMRSIFLALLFLPCVTYAVDTIGDNYGSENVVQPEKLSPFKLEGEYDFIFKSEFNNSEFKGDEIGYNQGGAEAQTVCCYRTSCNEGLALAVGYTNTYLDWNTNPFFNQESFNTLSVAVSGWSNRLSKWLWQGQIAMNMDLEHYTFDYYTTWDFLLWGRYTYTPCIGIHAGFLAQTGMKVDRYYPIFGFDWQFRERWKLNAIFPMNISIVYTWNQCWNIALASRFFDTRHRAGVNEPLERAVFEYRTTGAELAINYDYGESFHFNIHGGGTFGGKLKITNQHHSGGQHFKFDAAPYIGGQAIVKF